MGIKVKQGDECVIPVRILINSVPIPIEDVDRVEFIADTVRKMYPGDVTYDAETKYFHLRLLQEDTFTFPEDDGIEFDVRVKFKGGAVIGDQKVRIFISINALSEEVI